MRLSEAMRVAWDAILKNKIRAFLTMLGIIIGVAAVIMSVAISTGTEATIQDQITSLGSNLLFVQSNFGRGGPGGGEGVRQSTGLIYDDATAIQNGVSGVAAVVVEQNTSQTIKYGSVQLTGVAIDGSSPGLPTVRGIKVANGRYFNDNDVTHKQKVAVLGYKIAQELFGKANPLGQYVQVGTTKLAVIGVMAEKGSCAIL